MESIILPQVVKDKNHAALRVAMASLYDTHIEDQSTAKLRGIAIQALGKLADALELPGLIREMESIPFSRRRRESPLWEE
jgi:hypothetical protein